MEKNSGVLYRDFVKGARMLPLEMRAEAYDAYSDLVLDGTPYEGDNIAVKVLLASVESQVEKANRNYEKKVARIQKINEDRDKSNGDSKTQNDTDTGRDDIVNKKDDIVTISCDTVTERDDIVNESNDIATNNNNNTVNNNVINNNLSTRDSANKRGPEWLEAVRDAFNTSCPSLPKVTRITKKRRDKIQTRAKSFSGQDFLDCFRMAEESDFLSGRNGKWTGCSFDWIIDSDEHMQRILEGVYARNGTGPGSDDMQSFRDAWNELDRKERSL